MTDSSPAQRDGNPPFDIFIIGGGINGCGIARDAAGRGLSVGLAEQDDLASATSSASTKLFHGGLRYLEQFEFRLVRESLREREILLQAMPHISWPMRFVMPYHPDMRFASTARLARLLHMVMPWLKGRRPAWLLRLGLFIYDHLGGRDILPGTETIHLKQDPRGAPLADHFTAAFEYSDCWVEDSRLVILNARDAVDRGATIMTRSMVTDVIAQDGLWQITIKDNSNGQTSIVQAKTLINAAGPWVADLCNKVSAQDQRGNLRLVRGSHIITRQLYAHDRAYFLQGTDGRIIFTIPYEQDYTLIGTTDVPHADASSAPLCSPEEEQYLLDFVSGYFQTPVTRTDVVARFSGVRPLYDDGAASASATTRDYVLQLDNSHSAPMLNIFGGKITTYRKLAELVMAEIAPYHPGLTGPWTAGASLPGGDFPVDGFADLVAEFTARYSFMDPEIIRRMTRNYGTQLSHILQDVSDIQSLGHHFGAGIYAVELAWSRTHEFTQSADDFLWRRTKLGLRITDSEHRAIDAYFTKHISTPKVA